MHRSNISGAVCFLQTNRGVYPSRLCFFSMQIVEKKSQKLSNNDYEYTNKLKDFIDKDHQLSIFSIILGTVIVVVGSFVLLGWFLNIEILKSLAPNWVTMKFTTALSFTLSGILILSVVKFLKTKLEFHRIAIVIPSVCVVFFMIFGLAENLLNIDSAIFKLFLDYDSGIHSIKKGLPSLGTMISFLTIGICGLSFLFSPKIVNKLIKSAGFSVFLVGVIGITGYIFGIPLFYYEIETISGAMALHTAILFSLTGTAFWILSKKQLHIPSRTLEKHEYGFLFGITISAGIFAFIARSLISLNSSHSDFWIMMGYLASTFVVLSAILLYQKISLTHKNLEQTIELRTKTIKDQLLEIKTINKAKEEFSAMISHELKTPITPIMMWADALREPAMLGNLTSEQKNAVNKISESAEQLKQLVGDMFDAYKLDLHKIAFVYEPLLVNKTIHEIINTFQTHAKRKNISIATPLSETIEIKSDARRIQQVLKNLINNAIDFVEKDKGLITVNAVDHDDSVLFSIKDNGVGISKENITQLFKKFYQIDKSYTREHGGSGLGLTISKGIVEGLGGKIWVESKLGEGTEFYFTIPKER